MKKADKLSITFRKLPKPDKGYGKAICDVYYVVKNGRSKVMEYFNGLDEDTKDDVKDLIHKMATVKNFVSPKVRWHLKGYAFGEIRPKPHRFFFFMVSGNKIIFFGYEMKKVDSLPDSIYKALDTEKKLYEEEFEKSIRTNR